MIRVLLITVLLLLCNAVSAATIELTCDKPTLREDGTAISSISGYRLYYSYNQASPAVIDIVGDKCGYTMPNADPGMYEFAISTVEGKLEGRKSAPVQVTVLSTANAPTFTKLTITNCYGPNNCVTQEISQ
jgi:hypothetical protein